MGDLYGKVDVPLVLLEALALGVPLVVARGGPLESLTSARLVEPHDEERLAAELTALLKNASAARSAAVLGRSLYASRFTPRAVAAAYDDLYAELVAGEAS